MFEMALLRDFVGSTGQPEVPHTFCLRAVVASWWLFVVVITSLYKSSLIAFLTVESITLPFNNLQELSEQTDYSFGVQKSTIFEEILMVGNNNKIQSKKKFFFSFNFLDYYLYKNIIGSIK